MFFKNNIVCCENKFTVFNKWDYVLKMGQVNSMPTNYKRDFK